MLRKGFAILCLGFSGCNSFPKVSPCVFSVSAMGCYYSVEGENDARFRPVTDMDQNVCHSADEYQAIVEWAKRQSQK